MAATIRSKQLDFFQPTPIIQSIVKTDWVDYKPVSQINLGSCVEFNVPEMMYHFMDLHKSRIKVKIAVERVDGKPLDPATDKVAPVNLICSSAFAQCIVSLQQQVITTTVGSNYPYKAYLDVLLSDCSGWDFVNELRCEGYYKDAGNFDDVNDSPTLRTNAVRIAKGQDWTLEGKIRMDICEQEKLILNNVSLRIKLIQSVDSFRLMAGNEVAYRLVVKDATLKLCRVKLSDEELIHIEEKLKHTIATYFFYRSDFKTHSLPKGAWSATLDDIYHGEIPTQVVVALVGAQAYSGDLKRSPFRFQHYFANFIELGIDGVSVPGEALKPNYTENDYVSAYLSLFPYKRRGLVSEGEYMDGYTMYLFSVHNHITPNIAPPKGKGHVRLSINFSKSLPESVTVLLYAKFADQIGIDSSRNILLL